ncbi:MAG: WD40 repeat domain-containing protein, partial [Lachnospiraceae bacterium]|nr:WD40 repeat domain-containing protein [Lachnospiraceae bacterium]
ETIYRDVSGLCFTEYGLAAGSEKDEDQDYISDGDGMIEMIDLESGEAIWSYPYTFEVYTFTSTYLKLYHRSYTDTDGQMISSVLFTKDNQVGALDCESGGKKSHFYVSSSIAAVGRYPDSGLIAVYESSGTVDYFNADTATEYRDNATSLGLSISKLRSNGEVMAIYQSTSPEVYLLKKHPGEGKQSLTTLENSIRRVVENEAENLYVVQCYSENALHVFDRDTMEEIYTFLSESSIYGFDVMDNGNLVVYYPGEFWRIDPKSGSKSVTELPIESCYNVLFYPSCQCAVAYSASGIVVYSYAGEETYVTYAGEGLHAKFVTLSADGTTLLVMTMDNELYVVNVAEETAEKIEEGTLKVLQNLSPENGMVLNTDGTLLAMSCMDGFVRVYDMAQETVIAKFAAVGRNRIFLAFSPDSRHLLLQADDYYFKVYDLESASVMMAAANQYNQILRAQFDETAGKVVLYGYDRSYILNADTYELTSYVEEGVLVNFARDLVLTHNRGELLSYPYLDLEELLALAGREVNGEELSEEKRLQLHVE